jgi:hypothetical protein
MDPAGVPALVEAIRHLHGCEAAWLESVPVHEKLNGETVWEGEVQVFRLSGHATAPTAYAWSYATTGGRRRFLAVLHSPPIDGPVAAVRAAIVADHLAKVN